MVCLAWCAAGVFVLGRETLDKVVAAVDNTAITRSDVELAYGFELFVEGRSPVPTPDDATREAVRTRQIDQLLLLREADTERISGAESPDTPEAALEDIRKKFAGGEQFESALRFLQLDKQAALDRLRNRQRILFLIGRRLRPSARVEPPDVEAYYKGTFIPELAKRGGTPPPLPEVQDQIREILTQKKIDELLNVWLENLKTSHRVILHPF